VTLRRNGLTFGERLGPPISVSGTWQQAAGSEATEAVEQSDAPDEALGLKVSEGGLSIINVRFAGIIETAWASLGGARGYSNWSPC
jgi:hypothetical protein